MAQNLLIGGVSYNEVSSLSVAKAGGGAAVFPDTSDATAAATDILSGKTAYSGGVKLTGTGTVGSGVSVEVEEKDVNFYDYDGTLIAAYTIGQARALTSLPTGPSHDGLVFQGWNWSLADVQALTTPMNIGALYTTSDGKTRLYISIATEGRVNVPICFHQTVSDGVEINWGDGSAAETISGTGIKNTSHVYSATGDYVITLEPVVGCTLCLGSKGSGNCVMGGYGNYGHVYGDMLKKVELGDRVSAIGMYSFYGCYSLTTITMTSAIALIDSFAFTYCYCLKAIVVPNGVPYIGTHSIQYCYAMKMASLPNSLSILNMYAFDSDYNLHSVTLPNGMTTFYNYAFQKCVGLQRLVFPNNVTSMGSMTVKGCHALSDLVLSDSAPYISASFAYECYGLSKITIPASVIKINTSAFMYCYGMAEYHFLSTTPPTLDNTNIFNGIAEDCVIYVPAASVSAYQAATNWSTYASYIQGE